jgi:two-component system, sensor histidine kinase
MKQAIRIVESYPGIRVPLQLLASRPAVRADGIATIAHELRNSLCVMRNAARLLDRESAADSLDRARILIERHVAQMCRHVDDLMALASNPTGKSDNLQRSHLDLRTIVEYAIAAISPNLEQRGHRLVAELPAEAIWVNADAARLEQVFSNVLTNAAKYTPDGGRIVITLERETDHARIRIRDSGIGIDPAMLPRVFDLYAQADKSATRAEGGRGIGLALVRELIEKHGGTVQAASAGLGFGSAFTITVPVLWATAPAAMFAGAPTN